ncbi:MAG: short-chain fatty acid transporter [Phycisphaerales bacterium]|nr:short-chain fatty acid transporter [Phycisphaerales bacterium]
MIPRLGLAITRVFRAIVPDPFVLAVGLTILTFVLALAFGTWGDKSLAERALALLDSWRASSGLWKLLDFAMKMCLVLVTGHALADAPIVKRALARMASLPRSGASAVAMVGFLACSAAVVNWGLGLIVGAILAREVGRAFRERGQSLHYPLVVAAGYTGLMVWHGGLSGSAPLSMTSKLEAAKVLPASAMASLGDVPVPLDQSMFAPFNLVITLGLLALVPLVLALLSPREAALCVAPPEAITRDHGASESGISEARAGEHTGESREEITMPDRLERSAVVMLALAIPLTLVVWRFIQTRSLMEFGLNEFCALMLALGLILHGSLKSYAASAEDAARGCAGIILQFPLYAGIMAMMEASGLIATIANIIASAGGQSFTPLLTFYSAAVINLFVPSGGGQWAVQGPIALQTGLTTGVPLGKMVMAVAYGDQLTNMLQPFWALPLLAITRARARDIVGYCAVAMLAGGVWISIWMCVM